MKADDMALVTAKQHGGVSVSRLGSFRGRLWFSFEREVDLEEGMPTFIYVDSTGANFYIDDDLSVALHFSRSDL